MKIHLDVLLVIFCSTTTEHNTVGQQLFPPSADTQGQSYMYVSRVKLNAATDWPSAESDSPEVSQTVMKMFGFVLNLELQEIL